MARIDCVRGEGRRANAAVLGRAGGLVEIKGGAGDEKGKERAARTHIANFHLDTNYPSLSRRSNNIGAGGTEALAEALAGLTCLENLWLTSVAHRLRQRKEGARSERENQGC
jgi:hypothetical protein